MVGAQHEQWQGPQAAAPGSGAGHRLYAWPRTTGCMEGRPNPLASTPSHDDRRRGEASTGCTASGPRQGAVLTLGPPARTKACVRPAPKGRIAEGYNLASLRVWPEDRQREQRCVGLLNPRAPSMQPAGPRAAAQNKDVYHTDGRAMGLGAPAGDSDNF